MRQRVSLAGYRFKTKREIAEMLSPSSTHVMVHRAALERLRGIMSRAVCAEPGCYSTAHTKCEIAGAVETLDFLLQ